MSSFGDNLRCQNHTDSSSNQLQAEQSLLSVLCHDEFHQRFEVLYCGRLEVGTWLGSRSLVDDCLAELSLRKSKGNQDVELGKRPKWNFFLKDEEMQALGDAGDQNSKVLESQMGHTMLFQVGPAEVSFISLATKTVVLETSFTNISFYSHGVANIEHFAFICRENGMLGSSHTRRHACYIFQCESKSLVGEVMQTLGQTFAAAASKKTCGERRLSLGDGRSSTKGTETQEGPESQEVSILPAWHKQNLINVKASSIPSALEAIFSRGGIRAKAGTAKTEAEDTTRGRFRSSTTYYIPASSTGEGHIKAELTPPRGDAKTSNSLSVPVSKIHVVESLRTRRKYSASFSSVEDSSLTSPPTINPVSQPTLFSLATSGAKKHVALSPLALPASTLIHNVEVHRSADAAVDQKPGGSSPEDEEDDVPSPLSSPRIMRSMDMAFDSEQPHLVRRLSWRKQIFRRVSIDGQNLNSLCDSSAFSEAEHILELDEMKGTQRSRMARSRWKKAIHQQVLLLRMERENRKLQASKTSLHSRRVNLDYEEVTPFLFDVSLNWQKMLNTPNRENVGLPTDILQSIIHRGVPRQLRGEIWQLLMEQHRLRSTRATRKPTSNMPYNDLLKQLTSQQHAILIDLGRTFPTHPYFSAQLGAGQLSLFNLLKAYSLLDREVGYCQGLSFVAGVLILHLPEEEAFELLKFLMYELGLRRQYRPDMAPLQVQMYQLSRLLHDQHRDLHDHLEALDIGPSLYAAPWFLTLFSSQFPLGFVARIFDFVCFKGPEVVFKVALSLLGSHKNLIMQTCNTFETVVDFLKTTLPKLSLVQLEKTINQVIDMDLSKQLHAYEVEYHVLQDVAEETLPAAESDRLLAFERTTVHLRQQNFDLLEELQHCHAHIHSLEDTIAGLHTEREKQQRANSAVELERLALLNTVQDLRNKLATAHQENLHSNGPYHAWPRSYGDDRNNS
uniref:TBC1 domain family member 1-like isoform X1 n=1 Tax=Myxine glutinosa TaxID=7769 RepID=UPI0035901CD4